MEEAADGKLGAGGESSLPFATQRGPRGQRLDGLRFCSPGAEVQSPVLTVTVALCLSDTLVCLDVLNVTFIYSVFVNW